MAQSFVSDAGVLTIPGATATIQVQQANSGLATTGILLLVGEADAGPDFSLETDLSSNAFGPDQALAVIAKYKSGPIVDSFRAACQPLNDATIAGAFSKAVIVKTNVSGQASVTLPDNSGSFSPGYGALKDLSYGKLGNLIYCSIATVAEVLPTTGTIFYVAPGTSTVFDVRVNGGAATSITVLNTDTRAQVITKLNGVAGITAVAGGGADDLTISLTAAAIITGFGKSFEIQKTSVNVDKVFVTSSGGSTAAPFLTAGAITVGSDHAVTLNVNRQVDSTSESISVTGDVILTLGYQGTSCTATIVTTNGVKSLSTTRVGGTGANLSISLSDFPTVNDLAAYISAQTGYAAKAATTVLGLMPSTALDAVSAVGIASTGVGAVPGRIKANAYRFQQAVTQKSVTVQLPTAALAGFPGTMATTFLSGGTRGSSSNAAFTNGLTALTKVRGNFVVSLFSRDASADIADGITDSGSTYQIDSINAAVNTHCLQMGLISNMKNRQGFVSKRDTFANAKLAAANLSAALVTMHFQDVKASASDGTIKQFQPWMASAIAAGAQAAGFYRPVFNKNLNISGALQAAADFSDQDNSAVTDALNAGLCPIRKSVQGGYRFVSDQTTYSKDSNFVWNSWQAIYIANVIALTTAQRMENAFVGQSVADVSAPIALAYLEAIMADFIRLKLIVADDEAPRGFKNAVVQLVGGALKISVQVKLAGAIYFIPISILVQQVKQTASA